MPYNTNYPYGQYQQPQTSTYAFVNGVEGAKSYMVSPNQSVMLMDSEQPLCYMKTTNSIGQGTVRYFKLIEINESDARNMTSPTIKALNENYVTKEDFNSLKTQIDELVKKLGNKDE